MKSKFLALLASLLLAVPMTAFSAVVFQVSNGILTGATGVDVGGTLYDVEFVDGTCADLFSGCDSNTDFTFQTNTAAVAASQALIDQVLLDIAGVGLFTHPELISGCTDTANCYVLTPYNLVFSDRDPDMVDTGDAALPERNASSGSFLRGAGTQFFTIYTWARWSPASVQSVPEPGTLALLGLGLAGLAASRRRKQSN